MTRRSTGLDYSSMVAEGVENQAVLTELTRNGCDQAQGYYLSRPMVAAELDHWLATRDTRQAPGSVGAYLSQ